MKKLIFILLAVLAIPSIYAMLPPLGKTLTEIEAIISDSRLAQELGSAEGITRIEKTENGYLITTFRYQLEVDIIEIPQELIGAYKFELKFHEKIPLEQKI